MCLKVSNQTVYTAKKDIVCYKMVDCNYNGMVSFYQGMKIELGKEYVVGQPNDFPVFNCLNEIGKNAFHSFSNKRTVMSYTKRAYHGMSIVIKCVIPKGSRYVIGHFSDFRGYCSDRIIYKKVIHDGLTPKDIRLVFDGSEQPIGIIFTKLKKKVLFRDIISNVSWYNAMKHAKILGKALPTDRVLKKMMKALIYFNPLHDGHYTVWSSTANVGRWAKSMDYSGKIHSDLRSIFLTAVPCSDVKQKFV